MSNFKIQGNAGGAGTTTLQSANTGSSTTFTWPAIDGSSGQFIQTDGSGNLVFASGLQTTVANIFTAAQTFRAANAIRSEAAATQDAVVIAGRAGGSSSYAVTLTPTTLSANRTVTIPNESFTIGFRNLPPVGTKTGSYTLAIDDVGKYVQCSSGSSITIPTGVFSEGDAITLYNTTAGNITITCSALTTYIAGTDATKTSLALATRGVASILFISGSLCVVTGSVS